MNGRKGPEGQGKGEGGAVAAQYCQFMKRPPHPTLSEINCSSTHPRPRGASTAQLFQMLSDTPHPRRREETMFTQAPGEEYPKSHPWKRPFLQRHVPRAAHGETDQRGRGTRGVRWRDEVKVTERERPEKEVKRA